MTPEYAEGGLAVFANCPLPTRKGAQADHISQYANCLSTFSGAFEGDGCCRATRWSTAIAFGSGLNGLDTTPVTICRSLSIEASVVVELEGRFPSGRPVLPVSYGIVRSDQIDDKMPDAETFVAIGSQVEGSDGAQHP